MNGAYIKSLDVDVFIIYFWWNHAARTYILLCVYIIRKYIYHLNKCFWFLYETLVRQKMTKMTVTVRYIFQAVIHSLWKESNRRRYGEKPSP